MKLIRLFHLSFIVLFILIISIVLIYGYKTTDTYSKKLFDRIKEYSYYISYDLSKIINSGELFSIKRELDAFKNTLIEFEDIYILDENKNILITSNKSKDRVIDTNIPLVHNLEYKEILVQESVKTEFFDTVSNQKYTIVFLLDKENINQNIFDTIYKPFFITLFALIIFYFISHYLLSKYIIFPLSSFVEIVNNKIESKKSLEDNSLIPEINIIKNKYLDFHDKLLDEKNRREELLEEQKELLSLFEIGEAILFKWNLDEEGTVFYVSNSVKKLFGYEKDDFLEKGLSYASCIHRDDLNRVKNEVKENLKNHKLFFNHIPYRIITKDGDIKWVNDYTIVVKDKNGKVSSLIGYVIDISDTLQKEQLIQNQSKMVALGEMIGNIAHQWRQPLSAIKTNISGIQLQNDFGILKSEDLDRYCNLAKVQIDYLSTTIEDFRNFINNTNERSKFSLSEIFKTFENLMTSTIKENNINLNIFIEKDMIINLYKNEINQCLINIFNNSKDAFEQNNIKRKEVRFSIKVENNQLIIVLQDNAGGIEEKIIDKIFEPYFTTKHQAVGMGLGLNIVYRLITECMKGTISASNENLEIDNQIYKGTKLTITIPIEPIN